MRRVFTTMAVSLFWLVTAAGAQVINWSDPVITINTREELEQFRDQVNGAAGMNFLGQTIMLGQDITLSGNWTPVGNDTREFRGTFDGNGRTISGLNISSNLRTMIFAGLFGTVGHRGNGKLFGVYSNV